MGDRIKYTFQHLDLTTSPGYDPTPHEFTTISQPDRLALSFEADDETADTAETFGVRFGVADSLELYEDSAAYVKAWLIDNVNASINTIIVTLHDTLCDKNLGIWLLKTDNLEWCNDGECRVIVHLNQYMPAAVCLRNTLIADNWRGWFPADGFIGGTDPVTGLPNDPLMHPKFEYCDDIKPQFLQNFLFVLAQSIAIMINTIVGPFILVLNTIQIICDILSIAWTPADDFEDQMTSIYEDIFANILSCTDVHPAPYVRNYFINACSKCGLNFTSTILNNSDNIYYNLSHLFAPVRHGFDHTSSKDWINDNAPIYNALTYAFSLKDIFNAKYRIVNDKFLFERKDKFTETPIDLTGSDANYLIGFVCYSWDSKKKPAYQSFEYSLDGIDTDGNNARHRFNGIKSYGAFNQLVNSAGQRILEGADMIRVSDYGAARFTTDGIEKRKIFEALSESFGFLDHYLLMDKAETGLSKLLIYEPSSPMHRAETIRVAPPFFDDGIWINVWNNDYMATHPIGYNIYNYPMMYLPDYDPTFPFQYDNLYKNFHAIDDPTAASLKSIEFNLKLQLCCETLNRLMVDNTIDDGVTAKVDTQIVLEDGALGKIERLDFDFDKCEIRVKGKIKYSA